MATDTQPQPAPGQLWRLPNGALAYIIYIRYDGSVVVASPEENEAVVAEYSGAGFRNLNAVYIGEIAALPELIEACDRIAGAESLACQRCEGNGRLWADGRCHYPNYESPTTWCPNCQGVGRIPDMTIEEIQEVAAAALAHARPPQKGE